MKYFYGFCGVVALGPPAFALLVMLLLAVAGCQGGEGSGVHGCHGLPDGLMGNLQILSLVALFASPISVVVGAVLAVGGAVFQRFRGR